MLETDYLVVGAGALGMAFTDQLLAETDASITIVDRRHQPGGHWNDAYPFVRLHQPSAFYGAGSRDLGSNRIDNSGINEGFYELASGAEVLVYFDRLMREHFLETGRVNYFSLCEYRPDQKIVSLASGEQIQVKVHKRVVDATYFDTRVPATTPPRFPVAPGIRLIAPNALPVALGGYRHFTILGGGKTGMDVGVWLLRAGVPSGRIRWVVPRDSWLINRETVQPGDKHYRRFLEARAQQLESCARASSREELFSLLEADGLLLRLDAQVQPAMYHNATIAPAEIALLRNIDAVIRLGRVRAIEEQQLLLDEGRLEIRDDELFIDCTASAITRRPVKPVFADQHITLQMIRAGQFCFSASVIAYVEAHYGSDEEKNTLCQAMAMPDSAGDWLSLIYQDNATQGRWQQDRALRAWSAGHRLSGANLRSTAGADGTRDNDLRQRIRDSAGPAQANLRRLMETSA